ncbi:Ornithine decarboxylase [Escherichia coli]|nr:Ornithine decarboxylase [Escherichia coli]
MPKPAKYSDFGVPATILAHYLRENGIVPEKCDLNSILFLLTPAESHEKLAQLVAMLAQFEQHIEDDSPLAEVLPSVYNKYPVRYRDYTPAPVVSGDARSVCQFRRQRPTKSDVPPAEFPVSGDEPPGCA